MPTPAATRKVMIIAGETSGDRLAARAIREANEQAARTGRDVKFFGIGGDRCKAEGMQCDYDTTQMSVVGFLEVAKRYGFFRSVFATMVSRLDDPATRPDVILLVDYPGFNIRFAAEAKKRGIEVIYYVSPQVWAWKPKRVRKIVASVNRMLVIFPFEQNIYTNAGLAATEFVGHPLIEILDEERRSFVSREEFARTHSLDASKRWLLLFPGSRSEEVRRHLPIMAEAARLFATDAAVETIVVESANIDPSAYSSAGNGVVHFRSPNDVHQLMTHGYHGILKSGTTTLEAAIAGLPGVICYRTSWLTYFMARALVKLNYIGLANIVLGKMLYPEVLQHAMTPLKLAETLRSIDAGRDAFVQELSSFRAKLASDRSAPSLRVAQYLLGS
ncbi:MAG: lipid-A-disaccharide synthase [Bacteroidetes bacterium]|nr:lipid-A-disaccharide synthase [Bacteroidota bacterium]